MTTENELDALNWALFDALGYAAGEDVPEYGVTLFRVISPGGLDACFETEGALCDLVDEIACWARDDSAALALCLELGTVIISSVSGDAECGCPPGYRAYFKRGAITYYGYTPAEALARLALAALEGQGAK